METNHIHEDVPGGVPLKMWTRGVPVEDEAKRQLTNAARLPIVFKHIAAMPDVHFGIGATVGSVIPTLKAIIPAAVGVDIGCGMIACKTTLTAEDLPDNLGPLRAAIERAVPHGRSRAAATRAPGRQAPGAVNRPGRSWSPSSPSSAATTPSWRRPTTSSTWARWAPATTSSRSAWTRRASCGSCCTRARAAWATSSARLHRAGQAGRDAQHANLPDRDLAYFEEGSRYFGDYVRAVGWAQTSPPSTAR
jgi:tRNA-splicing ligase RtcB